MSQLLINAGVTVDYVFNFDENKEVKGFTWTIFFLYKMF